MPGTTSRMCGEDHEAPVLPRRFFLHILHNVPDRLLFHAVAPDAAHFSDFAEDPAPVNPSSTQPVIQFRNDPVKNRHRADVCSLAQQIDNRPVILPLLEMIDSQGDGLMPSQATLKVSCVAGSGASNSQRWSSPQRLRLGSLAGVAFGLVVNIKEQDREHGDCPNQHGRHDNAAEVIEVH